MKPRQVSAFVADDGALFKTEAEATAHNEMMYWNGFYKTIEDDWKSRLTEDEAKRIIAAWELYRGSKKLENIREATISSLDMTVRTTSSLVSGGITTVGMLIENKEYDLLRLPNLGRKSLNEIKETLATLGLTLKPYENETLIGV